MHYSVLSLAFLILILQLLALISPEDNITRLLEYNREAITGGEYWRVISGHLVHNNLYHTATNLTALVFFILIFMQNESVQNANTPQKSVKEFTTINLLAMIFISTGLYIFSPDLHFYVGFSGVLHALFVYYFIVRYQESPLIYAIVLIVIFSKLAWEQTPWHDSASTAALIETPVATLAHLLGGTSAVLLALISYIFKKNLAKKTG